MRRLWHGIYLCVKCIIIPTTALFATGAESEGGIYRPEPIDAGTRLKRQRVGLASIRNMAIHVRYGPSPDGVVRIRRSGDLPGRLIWSVIRRRSDV